MTVFFLLFVQLVYRHYEPPIYAAMFTNELAPGHSGLSTQDRYSRLRMAVLAAHDRNKFGHHLEQRRDLEDVVLFTIRTMEETILCSPGNYCPSNTT